MASGIEEINMEAVKEMELSSRSVVMEELRDIPVGMYGQRHAVEYTLTLDGRLLYRGRRQAMWLDGETGEPVVLVNPVGYLAGTTGTKQLIPVVHVSEDRDAKIPTAGAEKPIGSPGGIM